MTRRTAVRTNETATRPAAVGKLLMPPEVVPDQRLGWCRHLPPMPAAHGLPEVRQSCAGSSQPLVEVRDIDVRDAYGHLGILPAPRMRVRSDVAKRLLLAERLLPSGFLLVVLDAWRSPDEQRALVCFYGDGAAEVRDLNRVPGRI